MQQLAAKQAHDDTEDREQPMTLHLEALQALEAHRSVGEKDDISCAAVLLQHVLLGLSS